jgi:hypothetical protein
MLGTISKEGVTFEAGLFREPYASSLPTVGTRFFTGGYLVLPFQLHLLVSRQVPAVYVVDPLAEDESAPL